MVNTEFYSNAKIYKIIDNTNGNIYVGSTCKKLCQRIAQHRADYKRYLEGKRYYITSFKIIENGDYDIILLEEVKDCENKEQLRVRERHYIENLDCINKLVPGRTREEIKDYQNKYREENKETMKQYNKKYCETNKEAKQIKDKEYYQLNKEFIKNKMKTEYEANKNKINAKIICPCCNTEVVKRHFQQHEKTDKHQNNLNKEN
jgi:hypothetical protein